MDGQARGLQACADKPGDAHAGTQATLGVCEQHAHGHQTAACVHVGHHAGDRARQVGVQGSHTHTHGRRALGDAHGEGFGQVKSGLELFEGDELGDRLSLAHPLADLAGLSDHAPRERRHDGALSAVASSQTGEVVARSYDDLGAIAASNRLRMTFREPSRTSTAFGAIERGCRGRSGA